MHIESISGRAGCPSSNSVAPNVVALDDARFMRRFANARHDGLPHLGDDVRDAMFGVFGWDPPYNVRRACALYAMQRPDLLWPWAIEQSQWLITHTPSDREMEARIERLLDGLRLVRSRERIHAAGKVALFPGVNGPASWGA